jgi:hypothetical protein
MLPWTASLGGLIPAGITGIKDLSGLDGTYDVVIAAGCNGSTGGWKLSEQ